LRAFYSGLAFLLIGVCQSLPAKAQTAGGVTVFAAASLSNALQEVCDAFTVASGVKVKLSFAASSTLAKQIEAGAGAQVFVSADEAWMDFLAKRGLIEEGSRRPLLGNTLVLVVPADQAVQVEIAKGNGWLAKLPSGRIATGDPAHVPAGRYAEDALRKLGVWDEVGPRLARADNVRNALILVERGEAAAGIVYGTDAAVSKKVAVAGLFPESSHDPITYPVALMKGQGQGGPRALYDFMASDTARTTFAKHGFAVR
jgi:molybdate transport system substrate-binding protein